MNELLKMELHTTIWISGEPIGYYVTRVPGGWLYLYKQLSSNVATTTFVPEPTQKG